ncbi:MAG: GIY-YIG nuclease family protein [Planctomycetota bacterium]|jgi:putative endonuclease
MSGGKQYYVYIMTNRSGTLYVGLTSDIKRRIHEHKNRTIAGFTSKYNIDKLLYFETFGDIHSAIAREKTIKGWLRNKKLELVRETNPEWLDLSKPWYD